MEPHVKDMRDLAQLFATKEGGDDMPTLFKKTPARLDAIIQVIWHYQHINNGLTPPVGLIETESDIPFGAFSHYRTILENSGRVDIISRRPFRAIIKSQEPHNKAAIARKRRELEKLGLAPHQIAPELPFKGCPDEFESAQPAQDPQATLVAESVPSIDTAMVAAASQWSDASDAFLDAKTKVRQLLPRLLKVAEVRDLIHELVERGYVVSKGR